MRRVGGQVTWLVAFEGPMADLVARGLKRQTLRRCSIVAAGDTLRLAGAETGGVFGEATCTRARRIEIGVGELRGRMTCRAELDGADLSREAFDALAVADGFEGGARELVEWLESRGKFAAGLYEGQLIEW